MVGIGLSSERQISYIKMPSQIVTDNPGTYVDLGSGQNTPKSKLHASQDSSSIGCAPLRGAGTPTRRVSLAKNTIIKTTMLDDDFVVTERTYDVASSRKRRRESNPFLLSC